VRRSRLRPGCAPGAREAARGRCMTRRLTRGDNAQLRRRHGTDFVGQGLATRTISSVDRSLYGRYGAPAQPRSPPSTCSMLLLGWCPLVTALFQSAAISDESKRHARDGRRESRAGGTATRHSPRVSRRAHEALQPRRVTTELALPKTEWRRPPPSEFAVSVTRELCVDHVRETSGSRWFDRIRDARWLARGFGSFAAST